MKKVIILPKFPNAFTASRIARLGILRKDGEVSHGVRISQLGE